LPQLISEIGDAGASVLLSKIEDSPHLRMLCIKQNKLSGSVKEQFKPFSHKKPHILAVV
jgi:hypothetical protein